MEFVVTAAEARARYQGTVGLVPTMGFLHEGHVSLIERARNSAETVMVSLFVNPLQFNDPNDLARYPRDLERDAEVCRRAGADLLLVPKVDDMLPAHTRVRVEGVTAPMEGSRRPGHFEGVATIVAVLLASLRPDLALFGRKDAQQLAVVTTVCADLGFPVRVVACPTVREPDGLALSSRNVFLSGPERRAAGELSAGLFAAAEAVEAGGERSSGRLAEIVRGHLEGIDVEYVALAAQTDAALLSVLDRPAFLAVAASFGSTRLIDNVAFDAVGDGGFQTDRGVRLEHPSVLVGQPAGSG